MTLRRIEKLELEDVLKRANIEGYFPRGHIELNETMTIVEVRVYEKTQMISFLAKRGNSHCRIRIYNPHFPRRHHTPKDYLGAKISKLGAMALVNHFGRSRSIIAEWIGTNLADGAKANVVQRNDDHYQIEKDQTWRMTKEDVDSTKSTDFDAFDAYLQVYGEDA